ncbi:uncharacterized protein SPSK_04744 [Sporothrix schenckii 1099-18]|uniref:Uncharacterized protein n=1 Tax=Sporothrix schenckii 1099-18 TaxID=1397361 RepID=A0A0F2M177_SPOSC|nr:uncharacterized protein SPSK_04744 [Sporothrix schenckii 1099-18]KJR83447.1 hypothetical protein SPSK_04744 [Sporothrix schenckii 1099-18]
MVRKREAPQYWESASTAADDDRISGSGKHTHATSRFGEGGGREENTNNCDTARRQLVGTALTPDWALRAAADRRGKGFKWS